MTREEMIAALIAGGLDDHEFLMTQSDDQLREHCAEMDRQKND